MPEDIDDPEANLTIPQGRQRIDGAAAVGLPVLATPSHAATSTAPQTTRR